MSLTTFSNNCGYKYGSLVLHCLCVDSNSGSSTCAQNISPPGCSSFGALCQSECKAAKWPAYFYTCFDDPYTTVTETATKTVTSLTTETGSGSCNLKGGLISSGGPSTSNAEKSYKKPLAVSLLVLSSVIAMQLVAS